MKVSLQYLQLYFFSLVCRAATWRSSVLRLRNKDFKNFEILSNNYIENVLLKMYIAKLLPGKVAPAMLTGVTFTTLVQYLYMTPHVVHPSKPCTALWALKLRRGDLLEE